MTVSKKKRITNSGSKDALQLASEDPPEGTLDDFFGWLNEKYGIKLPRLSECPAESVARDLLSKVIKYEEAPGHIMYQARIAGEITVFEHVLLSGFKVQIEKSLINYPKKTG
jgi:hypothetical protein